MKKVEVQKITKKELVDALVGEMEGVSKKETEQFLSVFSDVVKEMLLSGKEVSITGLGTFKLKHKPKKEMTVGFTGNKVEVPERYSIKFQPSASFKKQLIVE
jgi:nucleoid DNA-binding protein